jgi:uncharacterized protein (DUF2141 family)
MFAKLVAFSKLAMVQITVIAAPCAAPVQTLDIRPDEQGATCGSTDMQVEVAVYGVYPTGILTVELYAPSERDFLKKDSRIHRVRVPAAQGAQRVCFDVPEQGRYAVAAYHDLDADRDLDQKWNRMPAEPFALSNREELPFGFPKFEDSAFRVGPDGTRIELELSK